MSTYTLKPKDIDEKWHVVDATGRPLGRLASEVAATLRGKNRPTFTPSMGDGDFVIVVNAAKVKVTGDTVREEVLPPLDVPGRPEVDHAGEAAGDEAGARGAVRDQGHAAAQRARREAAEAPEGVRRARTTRTSRR